jgi:hypothetical protein
MNETLTSNSLRTAFYFPFKRNDWIVPFIIGTALFFAGMIVPIIPILFVYGYFAEIMRMSINGEEMVLPNWANWGKLFKDGLRCAGVGLVYLGPGIVVSMIGFVAYFVMIIASIALTPESSGYDSTSAGWSVLVMFAAMGTLFLSMFFGTILLMAGAIPLPAALAHLIAQEKFGAAFHIREWTRIIRRDSWGYFIAWVLVVGLFGVLYLGFMLAYLTFILCFIGYLLLFPVSFYIMLVSAALFGKQYRESVSLINQDE